MRIEGEELTREMLLRPVFNRAYGMPFNTETQTFIMKCMFEQLFQVYAEGHVVIDEDGMPYENFSDIDVQVALYRETEFCQVTLFRRPTVAN